MASTYPSCWWKKSGVHQLRLVVYPVVYRVFCSSKRGLALGFLNHQPSPNHLVFPHDIHPLLLKVMECGVGQKLQWVFPSFGLGASEIFDGKLTCQLSFPRKIHLGGFKDFLFLPPKLEEMTQFWRALVFSIGLKRPTGNISPMKIDAWKMLHFLSHGPFSGDIPQFFGGGETSSLHKATLENKMIWAGEQYHFKMWNFIILKTVLDRSLRPEELLWINQYFFFFATTSRSTFNMFCYNPNPGRYFFKMSFLASSLEFWWFFWDWENKWLFGILLKNSNPSHMK